MTREEAKREILFAKREVMADSWIDKAYDMAIKALAQPEIVRCKECKFYTETRTDLKTGICSLACRHLGDDGFCSEAERKEG